MGNSIYFRPGVREPEPQYSYRVLEEQESYRLEALYRALDAAGRRRRFCAAVSDESIRSHCEQIWNQNALVFGAFQSNRMDAAIEVVPFSAAWDEAEIAFTSIRRNHEPLLSALLQLTIDEARRRSCTKLFTLVDNDDATLRCSLSRVGRIELDDNGFAWIDIDRSYISPEEIPESSPLPARAVAPQHAPLIIGCSFLRLLR
jgi:hypothetical protein